MKKQSTAPSLSVHLLQEASKFHFYPNRISRTRTNLEVLSFHDKSMEMLVQWRETFAPCSPQNDFDKLLTTPVLLNEFYCRDLLKAVPDIVERIGKLSRLTLSGISDSELVYLRQAAKCYIFGLPQAAVALARAALEDCLRNKFAKAYGKAAVAQADLKEWIDDLARTKSLSREGRSLAHKVRVAANDVLHPDNHVTGPPDALGAIEAARAVIMELSRR